MVISVKRALALALAISVVFIIAACSPVKRVTPSEPDPGRHAVDQTLAALRSQETSFDFFSARYSGTAHFEGVDYSISGNIRIKNDSAVFISVAPFLGIEVARLLVTPDSVKMINRLDNSYFEGNIRVLSNMLNTYVDFYMLQALLVGNDFRHFSNNDLKISNDRDRILLQGGSRKLLSEGTGNVSFQHNLWLNSDNYRIEESLLYEPLTRRSLRAVYNNNSRINGQWVPREVSIIFTEPGSRATMNIRYSRTTIDQPQTISFSIPNTYTPLSF